MSGNGKAIKRINLSFSETNANHCDDAMFDYIDLMVQNSQRTGLYHNAFRSGVLLAMIDDRLPAIFATLASKDDPKKSFLSALSAVGLDISWTGELNLVGYRKRTLLADQQREVIPNENGYTLWTGATKEEFELFTAGGLPEGTQVEALFAKTKGENITVNKTPEKTEVNVKVQEVKPVDKSALKARDMMSG